MDNPEKFLTQYLLALRESIDQNPGQYRWYLQDLSLNDQNQLVRDFAAKMVTALKKGEADKDSPTVKKTCKSLGIRHTYKAIELFLNS